MKKIILMVFLMLLTGSLYCDVKQDIDALLHPNILNYNVFAQNELINDKIPNTQPAIKDTVSQKLLLKRPKTCFTFALDTVVMPGIKIGFGWIKYDSTSTQETFLILHGNSGWPLWPIFTTGIHGQVNTFRSPERDGFYTSCNIGLDYLLFPGTFLSPYFTFGIGYSFKTGNNSFFRISGDLGVKWLLASITLSYVF